MAIGAARPAHAQSAGVGIDGSRDVYRAEIAAGVWIASPNAVISSGTLGLAISDVDFVGDLGLIPRRLPQLRATLRAGRRHKVRIGYQPTHFEGDTTLRRTIAFGSTNFTIGIPVTATLTLRTWRAGYQYDVVSRERFVASVIGEVRYARVGTGVQSGFLGVESSLADAFVPVVGGSGRVFLHPRVALTGELMWLQIPELLDGLGGGGRSVDGDVSGLVLFSRHVGIQVGYRTFDVNYQRRGDSGAVGLRGMYVNSLIRF